MTFRIEEFYIHPKTNVNTVKSPPSGLYLFIYHPFPYDVSTLHVWFQKFRMRPGGWQFSFPHSPAVAQTTLSLVYIKWHSLLSSFMD